MGEKGNIEILIDIIREMTAASRDQEAAIRELTKTIDQVTTTDAAQFKILRRVETLIESIDKAETKEVEQREDRTALLSRWAEGVAGSRPIQISLEIALLACALWVGKILGVLQWIVGD